MTLAQLMELETLPYLKVTWNNEELINYQASMAWVIIWGERKPEKTLESSWDIWISAHTQWSQKWELWLMTYLHQPDVSSSTAQDNSKCFPSSYQPHWSGVQTLLKVNREGTCSYSNILMQYIISKFSGTPQCK